ncbi:MAG: hypothetical protein IPM46_04095 [Flavobacteriales bacterium]|nr:hypothetical protein [Flavobacteriales bacterium]
MFNPIPLLAAALFSAAPFHPRAAVVLPEDGGPPSIRIAGKASGDITAAQWSVLKTVDLAGCVPDARIVSLTFCIKDCKGKDAMAGGENGMPTDYQRQMIRNLPPGTPFKVQVVVRDAKGKTYDVPEAHFVWKG